MPGKGARARYRKKRAERHAEFLKEACTKIAEPQRPGDQAGQSPPSERRPPESQGADPPGLGR